MDDDECFRDDFFNSAANLSCPMADNDENYWGTNLKQLLCLFKSFEAIDQD